MYAAGPFSVPFPFTPYPLQLHAMEAIRGGLAAGDVVVLESPTGTGKTQVLLNGVLSHVFEPVVGGGRSEGGAPQQSRGLAAAAPPAAETVRRVKKRQRKQKKNKTRRMSPSGGAADEDAFLVEQDAHEELSERQRQLEVMMMSRFSSSSRSSSSLSGSSEEEDEAGESEPLFLALQKPKVYFSSRTHTQLQQLSQELGCTVFSKYPVRLLRRQQQQDADISKEQEKREDTEPGLEEAPHMLRYVHVAGRQQLCLNARIRAAAGNSNERLNELCLESIAYEFSKEGRAARKQEEMRNKNSSSLADIEDSVDSEGMKKGCSYCRRERLKILKDYVDIAPRGLSEMRELGRKVGACPFLATRELIRAADVVFIPYSYLVSPEMRHVLLSGTATNECQTREEMEEQLQRKGNEKEINNNNNRDALPASAVLPSHNSVALKKNSVLPPNFSGDVVVVDEAHNLVDFCRNATSSGVSERDLLLIRKLLDGYYTRYEKRLLTRNKQRIREMMSFLDKLLKYIHAKSLEQTTSRMKTVLDFSSFVFDANVDNVNIFRFLAFLSESQLLQKLHGLVAFIALSEKENPQQGLQLNVSSGKNKNKPELCSFSGNDASRDESREEELLLLFGQDHKLVTSALRRFESFLNWYNRSDEYTHVILRQEVVEKDKESKETVMLQLLQLEPGMHTLFPLLQEVQSAVLAGGTMKPLALTCDLLLRRPKSLQFPSTSAEEMNSTVATELEKYSSSLTEKKVRFTEEGHVVPSSSIAVFTLGVGPSGYRVELQHSTRNQWTRQFEEIGAALLNFCQVIPDGMIVFFTSYEVEELFVGVLQRSGMYDSINEVKNIFRELSRSQHSKPTTNNNAADGDASGGCDVSEERTLLPVTVDAMLSDYTRCIRAESSRGAILFAVMGGKLSEGINFNDDLGRAVIIVGLPFANPSDVELQLYLGHIANTRLVAQSKSTKARVLAPDPVANKDTTPPFNSSAEWNLFTDLCMRTVNQSMGRCIRHAGDYAVVILFDARYEERADIRRRIPSWMQPSIRITRKFGDCFRGVRGFFAEMKQQQLLLQKS